MLGPDEHETKEITFLGRRIQWTTTGLEWRGDTKQVERFILRAGLAAPSGVDTPGAKPSSILDAPEMSSEDAT